MMLDPILAQMTLVRGLYLLYLLHVNQHGPGDPLFRERQLEPVRDALAELERQIKGLSA